MSSYVQDIYRIKLPGQPILGEGKPENQNHAIIFTRGEGLQTIDMNQVNIIVVIVLWWVFMALDVMVAAGFSFPPCHIG